MSINHLYQMAEREGIFQGDSFFNFTEIVDPHASGFSVIRGEDIDQSFVSIYRVYRFNDKFGIVIEISYGKYNKESNSVTTSSGEWKRDYSDPINMVSRDEYSISLDGKSIFNRIKKPVQLGQAIGKIEAKYLLPTKIVGNLYVRMKIFFFRTLWASLIKGVFYFVGLFYFLIWSQKVNIYYEREELLNSLRGKESDLDTENSKNIKIFEYEIHISVAFLYALIHLIMFYYLRFSEPSIWSDLLSANTFISIMYVVVTLSIFELVAVNIMKITSLKKAFKYVLKKLRSFHFYMTNKGVRL